MKCPICDCQMVIDEWNGWVWECLHCDYVGRTATNEETEKQRAEVEAYWKQQRINKE